MSSVYGSYVGVHSVPLRQRRQLATCERCGIRREVNSRAKQPRLCQDCRSVVRVMGDQKVWS